MHSRSHRVLMELIHVAVDFFAYEQRGGGVTRPCLSHASKQNNNARLNRIEENLNKE